MSAALQPFLSLLIQALVPLLALGIGLSTSIDDLRRQMTNPVLWRALAVAVLGVPALAIVVAKVFPLHTLGQAVLVVMGISPGAPLLLNKAKMLLTGSQQDNVALAVVLAVALSFSAALLVPVGIVIVNALFPFTLMGSASAVLCELVPSLWLPLAAGLGLRAVSARAADRLQPAAGLLFRVVLLAAIGVVAAVTGPHFGALSPWAWVAMVVVTFGAALMGDLAARGCPADRVTIAYAVVLGNPAIALLVTRTSFPALRVTPYILLYVAIRALLMAVYEHTARRLGSRTRHIAAT